MRLQQFSKSRKLIMLIGDILLVGISYLISASIILNSAMLLANLYSYGSLFPILIVLTGLLLNINGLYSIATKRFAEILLSIAVTNLCTLILIFALSFFIQDLSYSRSVLFLTILLQCSLLSIWRYLAWRVERHIYAVRDVLLIGPEEECTHVYQRLSRQCHLMKLKYVCTDMQNSLWKESAASVDVIIMCPSMRHRHKVQVINFCYQHGKRPMLIPNAFEIFCSGAELDKIDDIPVFRPPRLHPTLEVRTLKRALDLSVAAIGLVCIFPFMLVTALAIKIGDHGPILYSQVRTGRDGKEFHVYKFRTMHVDAEKYSGPILAQKNDPRITALGRFLRAVRLDELPQIWNVLVGDMSIVGPRPERPFFVEQYVEEMPEYAYRHNVKPGITGLAQVYGKYNTTPFDKLVYDLMYIQRCNILTDLTIIIQTVRVLFTKSATDGVAQFQEEIDLTKYDIRKGIYGDF
ncbi:sugar transferase [Selenomonas infelix]|uniref:sugar transferase n=1 Tax=Selenomonas infelix TaxID=135082 RepID=UPI0002ED63BA|nr:sugar transferase [Selenomonas infelix]